MSENRRNRNIRAVLAFCGFLLFAAWLYFTIQAIKKPTISSGGVELLPTASIAPAPRVVSAPSASPSTRIYLGDRLVGTGRALITWKELMDTDNQFLQSFAVEPGAPMPSPERLAGAGATGLFLEANRSFAGGEWYDAKISSMLIRRGNGLLDPVDILTLTLIRPEGLSQQYQLPIRLRDGGCPSRSYVTSGIGVGMKNSEFLLECPFSSLDEKVKAWKNEIQEKGFWEPGL